MRMMADIESITASLPGLDCGSCGAPTCMAFAEDIVKNETNANECTIIMRELFHECLDQRKAKEIADKLGPFRKNGEDGTKKTNEQ